MDHGKDVPSEKLAEIRFIIRGMEDAIRQGVAPTEKAFRSVEGKISYVVRLNKGTGKSLRHRLRLLGKATMCMDGC